MIPVGSQATVAADRTIKETLSYAFEANASPTKPYFSRATLGEPVYQVSDARLRNAPTTPAPLSVRVTLLDGTVPIYLERVAGRLGGESERTVYQPLVLVPPVSVSLAPSAAIFSVMDKNFVAAARVTAGEAGTTGSLELKVPEGWLVSPGSVTLAHAAAAKNGTTDFLVKPGLFDQRGYALHADANCRGRRYTEGYRQVGYPGVVRDNLYEPAVTRVRGADVRVPHGLKVAYLPGTGDAVEAAFVQIGVAATQVSVEEIAAGKLAGYDALVMGVRAYAAHKDLAQVTSQVTAFAQAGGTVVVQYNTAEFGGSEAPYPLSLGTAEKVVEETAAVRFLEPQSQVLRWPNRITEHDFDGWVEERGHGFMGDWDPKYAAVTEVHDAGQDPQRGGLLVAPVGKGAYVYCAYALYRQLPEGVPGAFRLLANLVSLGRRP